MLLGGDSADKAPTADAAIVNIETGSVTPLAAKVRQARKGHTATLLPDGKVLILGGIGAARAVIGNAEQFDPATGQFQVLGDLGLIARSGHTTTVLASNQLLINGGLDRHDQALHEAEIYNLATHQAERFNGKLDTARMNHFAALLPGSDVLLSGGIGNDREPIDGGEVYKFDSQYFNPISSADVAKLDKLLGAIENPAIKSTEPAADADAAPVDRPLVVQFTQRMMVSTLDSKSVTLIGPHGAVPIKVVPVEYGLLLFVTPSQDLLPASSYTLFIKGATNVVDQALPFTAIGFATTQLSGSGAPTMVPADSPGLASAGPATAIAGNGQNGNGTAKPEALPISKLEQQAIDAAGKTNDSEIWLPDARHFKGDWRAKRGASALQGLPPLRAPDGVTALAGQVLTLQGRALPNVTLTIGGRTARTDATGRFLLNQPPAGDQVLSIDGQAASQGGSQYGFYQVRVKVEEHSTNVLGYTIWSPALDPAGNIALPSPTLHETVVTSPRIPGLELRIPVGTLIRDNNGKIVTEINMTAIPTDRPPFPIPNVGVPVYFTIQPGGAKLTSLNGPAQQGARLIYPNFSGARPGTRISFWNYDPQRKGWYIYGKGTVGANAKQVIPDPGVAIYEFTGAMVSIPDIAPDEGPPPEGCKSGDPVDCFTGLFLHESTDLVIQDVIPLEVRRTYRPRDPASRAFGVGTNLSYDLFIVGDTWPYTYQELVLPDSNRVRYNRISPGTSYGDAVYQNSSGGGQYLGSTIRYVGISWELKLKDGTTFIFADMGGNSIARRAAVRAISDRFGNALVIERDYVGNLTRITSPSGRYVQFLYDASDRIYQASDNLGRTLSYEYDIDGRLIKVTDPAGKFEAYTYDANHNILTVHDKRGNVMVTNIYDANNRVSQQTYADGRTNFFVYLLDADNKVIQADVTDERGIVTRMDFNSAGYVTAITKALGLPEQQVTMIERVPNTSLVASHTDAAGRKSAYTYDAKGNQLSHTVLAGTANATVVATMTYAPDSNQLASVTDAIRRLSTMSYDPQGNLIEVLDPKASRTTRSYNGAGQLIRLTDALGKSTNVSYAGYDVAQVTDPLNRSVSFFTDSLGRMRSATDALGNRAVYELDALDRVTAANDPANQSIASGFDASGNLTSLTDPKGNVHQFAFDPRHAPVTSTDPLNQAEGYVYDGKHNLVRRTDRKGLVTLHTYDALERLTRTTYADGSTIGISYDTANRPTQFVDSANGTITLAYDNRDRVTQVTTPKGSVAYSYYANGLRQSMTVAGQPALAYTYDVGDRLIRIDQAAGAANNNVAQSMSFTYDAASRRTRITYMNGVTRENSYDDGGQLTAITYKNPDGSMLGDLSYTYDNGGRRTGVTGSLARTALPDALPNAGVDAANRLTVSEQQSLTYDANGNLTGDASQSYVWNARDQLVQIKDANDVVIASFTYDALGRRQTKTVGGVASGYVYDGANIVQELAGSASNNGTPANVKASYVSGGIDEVFAQQSGSGTGATTLTYLTDALGSTVRLVDAAGAKVVDYTYDPYGNTSADAAVANSFQYTGRENDGTGLYYYRARYYAPRLARFISSDPIGLAGGMNSYAYVDGNPISRTDPTGLRPLTECEANSMRLLGVPERVLKQADLHLGDNLVARLLDSQTLAMTIGRHISFAPGKYNSNSARGMGLLAHEITHSRQFIEGMTISSYVAGLAFFGYANHPSEKWPNQVQGNAANALSGGLDAGGCTCPK